MEVTWDVFPAIRIFGSLIRYYSLIFIAVYIGGWAWMRWQIMRA